MNTFPRAARWHDFVATTQIEPRGVIYCGAHTGEDVASLLTVGFAPVLAIEPAAGAFAELSRHASGFVHCANVAVGAREGTTPFYNIRGVPTLSSTLAPRVEYWEAVAGTALPIDELVEKVEVPVTTLDHLVTRYPADYNTLYMNIQGGELEALRGATALLPTLDVILTEVNFTARYEGSPLFADLETLLAAAGYECMLVHKLPAQGFEHGDAWFVNTNSAWMRKLRTDFGDETRAGLDAVLQAARSPAARR